MANVEQSTFLMLLVFFIAAGVIGRKSTGLGILLPFIGIPCITYYLGDTAFIDVLGNVVSGFLTGLSGAIIIPLFWAGRKGRPASNIRFMNHGAMSRTTTHYNWIKDDNIEEPGRRR